MPRSGTRPCWWMGAQMTARPIVIVGAGGMGREAFEILRDLERSAPGTWDFLGFVDDGSPQRELLDELSADFLGSRDQVVGRLSGCHFLTALGDGREREAITEDLVVKGLQPATLVHPSAVLGQTVRLGPGSLVCAGSVITTNTQFGPGAQVNVGCTVSHDVRAGAYVTLSPGVRVTGGAVLGDRCTLFTGSVVIPRVRVGEDSNVGAGAVVVSDVAAGTTVGGVPARRLNAPPTAP